ncbi:kinase-like domain-containing protein [Armillaria luteobubalina]|uniref:Kinase-like domain-containing protein n=1 Tax=Armillaria luteobubalina TaxID=153913 RepID=A0AA39P5J9_9AGAR|nr:kinase-like domain-containing protein [Armillaria luteobubalina]
MADMSLLQWTLSSRLSLRLLIGDFNIIVGRGTETEDGDLELVPLKACSDEDKAYWVLLSKTEALSRSYSLDASQKQTGAKAMIVKLALQMAVAGAEFGFFFVKSTDLSRPGLTLLLSPAFKLQNKPLPIPKTEEQLPSFQTNILPEPFLAILVAMLCANLVPGHSVKSPPAAFLESLRLKTIPDVDEDDESDSNNDRGTGENRDEQSGIPACSLQVRTSAMMLRHPWLDCSDVHRIVLVGHPPQPLSNVQNTLAVKGPIPSTKPLSTSPPQLRNLLCAPRIPSTNIDTVTLVEQIRVGKWSSVYTCRVEGEDKLCIMKLVSECHSEMILREMYMYNVVLKGCSLIPQFYGTFQRPAGGWFGFLLENVGDSLEDVYSSEWSYVKADLGVVEWKNLVDSVKKLHSLGVMHGDLEPRNVARTKEGTFKFFDFGRSEMHRCQKSRCEEVRELLDV